ncbi:rhomboid family intramembrane serine protease [Natronospora cellulosivora (SeqCode)]
MLNDLYYRNKLGTPFITYILVLSCLLVTIPSYLNPIWYDVFGGSQNPFYFWQNFTWHLQHGSPHPSQLHTLLHLACNLLVALSCGVLAERVLGTKKFFLLTFYTVLVAIMYRFINFYGNGASGIVWSYSAVSFYILVLLWQRDRKKLVKEPVFYFFVFVIFTIWIVITGFNLYLGWRNSNIIHLVSTLIGFIFTNIWRKDIANAVKKISEEENSKKVHNVWDKRIIALSLIIPLFIIGVYSFSSVGVLNIGILNNSPFISDISPLSGSISSINESDGKVMILFEEEMKQQIDRTSINIYSSSGANRLKANLLWLDNKSLEINFNRELVEGDKINITLQGFYDYSGQYLLGNIHLRYE